MRPCSGSARHGPAVPAGASRAPAGRPPAVSLTAICAGLSPGSAHPPGHARATGTCWVMQCGPPPPNATVVAGTPTTSPGYAARMRLERLLVLLDPGDGHDHHTVAHVEVQVSTRRRARPRPPPRASGGKSVTASPTPPPARSRFSAMRSWFGILRGGGLHQHRAGSGEGGNEVDVPVGVAVLGEPEPEPHDPVDPEVLPQGRLDLLPRQRRVAVGVEEALLRGQERPLAVDGDRPALEHEWRVAHVRRSARRARRPPPGRRRRDGTSRPTR